MTATAGHPFWVPTLREWLDAGRLKPGQWLQTSAGTWTQISAIKSWTAPRATVHNLTVTDARTYYVAAGASSVLVHNCGGSSLDIDEELARLPEYSGSGPTTGHAVAENGQRYELVSGRGNDGGLVDWVNSTLQEAGVLPGRSRSGRAVDVEQKFAAIMKRDGISHADLFINFPTGRVR